VRTAIDSNVIVALSSIELTATRMAALLRNARAAGSLAIAAPVWTEHHADCVRPSPPRTGLVAAAESEAAPEPLEGGGAKGFVYLPAERVTVPIHRPRKFLRDDVERKSSRWRPEHEGAPEEDPEPVTTAATMPRPSPPKLNPA
jgi:hypothetical protein